MQLLAYLRQRLTPWLGRRKSKDTGAPDTLREQHARVQHGTGAYSKINFLPWIDEATGETDTRRREYRKMIVRDDAVKGAVFSKLLAVAALDVSVTPDEPDSGIDRQAADFIQSCLMDMDGGVCGLAEDVAAPLIVDGYATNEKVYAPFECGKWARHWFIRRLKPIYPDNYSLQLDEYGNLMKVVGQNFNAGKEWPPTLFTYAKHMPLYDNPRGMSDLAAAYRAYWIKDTAWKLRKEFLNVYARGPYLWGTYATDGQKAQLSAALENAMGAGWAAVPEGVKLELFDLALKGTTDFDSAIEKLDREITTAISGAVLQQMEGAKTGSYNAGAMHGGISDLRVWYLAAILARLLNEQVIPEVLSLNFVGLKGRIRVSFGGINDAELKDALFVDQGLQGMGVRLSEKEMLRKYRRSLPADEGDVLKAPQPPMPEPGLPGMTGLPGSLQFAEWDESEHPRGDDGKFVSGGEIDAAKGDSAKEDELRAKVTDPKERAKLDKQLGSRGDDTPTPKATKGKAKKEPWEVSRKTYVGTGEGKLTRGLEHSDIIKQAILDGKKVPDRVLKDYPGLMKGIEEEKAAAKAKADKEEATKKTKELANNQPELMTREEYGRAGGRDNSHSDWSRSAHRTSAYVSYPQFLDREHREAVESALSAGKSVPPEVLKDYPDLAQKQPKPNPATPSPKAPAGGEKPKGKSAKSVKAAPGKTDTPEFKKWFGDSKVTDAKGQPLVVYHGTQAEFDAFDKAKIGSTLDPGDWGSGFYFGPKATAEHYGRDRSVGIGEKGKAAKVLPVYLNIQKPFTIVGDRNHDELSADHPAYPELKRMFGKAVDTAIKEGDDIPTLVRTIGPKEFTATLQKHGYDGFHRKLSDTAEEWVAFEPEQIKAVDNRGTFDPKDKRFKFDEGGDPKAAAGDEPATYAEIALTGKPRQSAESALALAQKRSAQTLSDICRSAFTRYVKNRGSRKRLFDDEERAKLTEALAVVRSVGRLMGRVRFRGIYERKVEAFAEAPQQTPGALFGKDASPEKALDYFRGLNPRLGELTPEKFGPFMRREAFTLAVSTEETLLAKVQQAIAQAMEGVEAGAAFPEPTEQVIDGLLEQAGVSPKNSAYSDMVARTNMHDAYLQGSEAERIDVYRDDPEAFPVWRWDAVGDERTRASHLARDGKYYPGNVTFQQVRGDEMAEIANCRCVPVAQDFETWAELQAAGAEVESPPW